MLVRTTKPALRLLLLPSVLVASLALSACQKDATPTENSMSDTSEVGADTDVTESENAQDDANMTTNTFETTELNAIEKLDTDLSRHRWTLVSAKDAAGQPVSVLMDIKDQVTLSFNHYQGQNTLNYSVGCNTISAAYQLQNHTLTTEDGMSTKMSCGDLDAAESQLNTMMQGSSELTFSEGENPVLTQVDDDSVTLVWKGRLTAQAKYNSKGETIFWAVNAQKVTCDDNSSQKCLQVRPITYDDQGIKSSEGKWAAFKGDIDGYQHDGKHDEVIRLQRYLIDNGKTVENSASTPTEDYAYVLDAVIESSVVE